MVKYVTSTKGNKYEIDFYSCIVDGKTEFSVKGLWGYYTHNLKVGYRHERTWDDHLGNTPCGYYVTVPFDDGTSKRVYMF